MPRISTPQKSQLTSVDGFLTSILGKSAGRYAFICGTPPAGINIGDVFDWDGGSAVLNTTYAKLPPSLFCVADNESYSKASSTWASDAALIVLGVVTSQAALVGKPAGIYATNAAFGVASKGDIVYHPGGSSSCMPYLLYNDIKDSFYMLGETYTKYQGGWRNAVGPATYTETLVITATGGVSPGIGASPAQNYINLVDDGSGWCTVTGALKMSAAGAAGSGTYLINLPGGQKFDTAFHPLNTQTSNLSGGGEIHKVIPGSAGVIGWVDGTSIHKLEVVPHTQTQFKLSASHVIAGASLYYYFQGSTFYQMSAACFFQFSFRFKKA